MRPCHLQSGECSLALVPIILPDHWPLAKRENRSPLDVSLVGLTTPSQSTRIFVARGVAHSDRTNSMRSASSLSLKLEVTPCLSSLLNSVKTSVTVTARPS